VAKKIVLVCDMCVDDVPATTTLRLALNDHKSTLDVCAEDAQSIRSMMLPTMKLGQQTGKKPTGGKQATSKQTVTPLDPEQSREIRRWALANNVTCSKYGRVPQEAIDAYQQAHA
jgi:Lsr2